VNDIEVLVVGGGISGLAVAQRLGQQGIRVEVWDRAAKPGGMVRSVRKDGYLTEQAAAMLLNFRPDVTRFISEARLEDRKQPRIEVDHRYVISDGRLRELPMKMGPLLMSDIWSMRAKLRMMLEPLARRSRGGEESVSEFVRRRLGGEVLDKALGPYVAGLLASDPDRASAAAVLPRLVALERRWGSIVLGAVVHRLLRRRSAVQTEAFSFQGGMATLAGALAEANGVCFCGGHEAVSLLPTGNGWLATARTCMGEREVRASQVILSTPASTTAGLVRSTQTELASLLDTIEYAPLNVVHTGFHRHGIRHALDGNGFLSLGDAGAPLIGCMWMSSIFEDRAPAGRALLSNYVGGARHPYAASWSDRRLVDSVLEALRPLIGLRSEPEMVRVDRHRRALPLYHDNYCERVRRIRELAAPLSGLHLVANYIGGVSVRDRLACAMQAVDTVLATVGRPSAAIIRGYGHVSATSPIQP
jgi:oxygen-dependent protoporphyrinogen oxidase